MEKRDEPLKPSLVFVYHAESGLFQGLVDMAHKTFSPQTYLCNLCALTFSTFGMRKGWKQFLETLRLPLEFLHADQLKQQYGDSGTALPAIFMKKDGELELWIDADSINACRTMDDLKQLITDRLEQGLIESK